MTLLARTARRSRVLVLLALCMLLVTLPATGAQANTATDDLERDFVALVNIERAKQGLHALTVKSDIVSVARRHSARMAGEWRLYHNPTYSKEITGWQRVSENVGYGPSVEAIHRALMNSEGHRRNILDDRVTELGVGVVVKDGRVWVTQNFRRPSSNVTFAPASTKVFGDVSSNNAHAASILRMAQRGITPDCGLARFCPTTAVSRGEFASMLGKALGLDPVQGGTRFTDVSGPNAGYIEALAVAGLTSGCAADRFCPTQRLTREQLSTFFARALQLDLTTASAQTSPFRDVRGVHLSAVTALHARGIVTGCTTTTFCPTDNVTRAQTASMLDRNFGG